MCKACAPRLCRPLLFGDDRDRQGHIDVGMQVQLHLVLAGRADRTVGMRTSLRVIGWPALTAASAMSAVPIEPNSLPSVPPWP
jgi:hypothetical protein